MTDRSPSFEVALSILSDPGNPDWFKAFSYLSEHPGTAQLMIEVFSETLEEMGIERTRIDETTGDATYSTADIARAMGIDAADLDNSINDRDQSVN